MARLDDSMSFDPWLKEKSEEEKMREEIREEVVSDVKRRRRKKFLTCCLLGLLVVIFILVSAAVGLAKTGLIDVPVFSKIFYKVPVPQKVVTATPEEITNFNEGATKKLEDEVKPRISPGVAGQKIEVSLEFTEKELTAFLRGLEMNGESPISNSQISITPENLEIFGEINKPNKTYLTIRLKPEIKNGNIKITIQKIKIGTLPIPAIFGNFLVDKFLSDQLLKAEEAISKVGKLENIDLDEGKITLTGLVDVLVFTEQN